MNIRVVQGHLIEVEMSVPSPSSSPATSLKQKPLLAIFIFCYITSNEPMIFQLEAARSTDIFAIIVYKLCILNREIMARSAGC
jgi:hypothetical protein